MTRPGWVGVHDCLANAATPRLLSVVTPEVVAGRVLGIGAANERDLSG